VDWVGPDGHVVAGVVVGIGSYCSPLATASVRLVLVARSAEEV
jgi:hypothetical protein